MSSKHSWHTYVRNVFSLAMLNLVLSKKSATSFHHLRFFSQISRKCTFSIIFRGVYQTLLFCILRGSNLHNWHKDITFHIIFHTDVLNTCVTISFCLSGTMKGVHKPADPSDVVLGENLSAMIVTSQFCIRFCIQSAVESPVAPAPTTATRKFRSIALSTQ